MTIARIPEDTVYPDGDPIHCTMFVLCRNDATLLIPHPVLDFVPSCQRCADRLGYDTTGDLPVAEIEFEERQEYDPERDDFDDYTDTPPDYEGDKYATPRMS